MTKPLKFKVSSALKDIIGRDLIADDYIAVFELVKNSFDAHATRVDIIFEHNRSIRDAKLVIIDNGKGMNYDDLVNKWLFVAYSAKRDGSEDDGMDYRDKINGKRAFAGTKGIGRFSADRLGRLLYLETVKREQHVKVEALIVDWEEFERDIKDEFIDIAVRHKRMRKSSYGIKHGTVIEISRLRSSWDRTKLLKLKDSLAKLINPNVGRGEPAFEIHITAPDEREDDHNSTDRIRVNGPVKNFIFETLGLKTTSITVEISEKPKAGKSNYITTTLLDGGTLIYRTKEINNFNLLWNLKITLFYLNRTAKLAFARQMGLASRLYGNVFLYKNGFRIYPFGEPFEDPLNINVRKSRKMRSRLGTGELMGRIEIFGPNPEFKETSSRGSGLIKNATYQQLEECFEMILERFERYVVDIQQWGFSVEDEVIGPKLKAGIAGLVERISGSDQIIEFEAPPNLLALLEEAQVESANSLVRNMRTIAITSKDEKLLKVAKAAARKLEALIRAKEEAEADAAAVRGEMREISSQNLFLKSIKSNDLQEVVSFMHSIGISATTIDNYLRGIYQKLSKGVAIEPFELRKAIEAISFENRKILSITRFSTKANFKLYTEEATLDLVEFVTEYANNILKPLRSENISISVKTHIEGPLRKTFRPIEMSILIDNLVSNSIRAKARNFEIEFPKDRGNRPQIFFTDDGVGISEENLSKIFDFGFTTTSGSGLGLFHVREIIGRLGWDISVDASRRKGARFIITIK